MIDSNLPLAQQSSNDSYINAYTPPTMNQDTPAPMPTSSPMPAAPVEPTGSDRRSPAAAFNDSSEKIEDQNIFTLLGITDGTEAEREAFLDELQQVIWEDFLENDADLLLTADEKKKLDELKAQADANPTVAQEEMVVYLEKLIPDLEEIMLEKALELKEDMMRERIAGLKEYYQGQQDKLDLVSQAESLIAEGKWSSASQKLNTLLA